MADLEIRNLHVQAGDKEILRGLDLSVSKGEIHALMGPNGSGKSTLANAIMGHPNLDVTEGQILFKGEDITEADTDERARMGLFMAFQYPVSVPGVTVTKYLRTVMNAHREANGEEPIPLQGVPPDGRGGDEADQRAQGVLDAATSTRASPAARRSAWRSCSSRSSVPSSRSSTRPTPGLDIDALRVVANGVNSVAGPDMGVLIITHYQRILHLVQPSHVHVIYQGRIVKEGGPDLVDELEAKGYGWITDQVAA